MFIALPFIGVMIGLIAGLKIKNEKFVKATDIISNFVLILLMVIIGANIGINDSLMKSLGQVGINCFLICVFAMGFSIIVTFAFEKSMKLLDNLNIKVDDSTKALSDSSGNEAGDFKSPLVWGIPLGIILGVVAGRFIIPAEYGFLLDHAITFFLLFIYLGVGISLGNNTDTLKYMKQLGLKILLIPAAVFLGSILGGIASGLVLGLPLNITLLSSVGMSYYSVTGAFMSSTYGVEVGTYGFVVNVFREFLTVLCVPLIVRISPGSAIACGGAADMDTMLLPIQKFVGKDLGLVTMFTGTILTIVVPFALPAFAGIIAIFN